MARPDSARKSHDFPLTLPMAESGPASAAMIYANTSITHVRSAVATSESVVLMPHLARIDVMPAKNAEANAAAIQDIEVSPLSCKLFLIDCRRLAKWWAEFAS